MPDTLRKRFHQAPRPYVFDVPRQYLGQPNLELGLVLVGRAIDYLPYFIYVVQEMGQTGLGQARVKYRLTQVVDGSRPNGDVIFDEHQGLVGETAQGIDAASVADPRDADIDGLTLEFLTPLRIKKFGQYQHTADRIDFATLMDLLWGRLEALALFHCDTAPAASPALRDLADNIRTTASDMHLQRLQRYSNRRRQKLPLDGLVGTMRFAGPLAPFMPLLRLGAHVHIGAGTAFGLGQYRVCE